MKIFIKFSYCGTAYSGYQVQSNAPTIQGELNKALCDLFGFECDITGCSRTDAGVHALDFCATVSEHGKTGIETCIPMNKLPFALNVRLPADISVFHASWVDDTFHARYSVKSKTYVYRILNTQQRDPFECSRAYHYPLQLTADSLLKMQIAAKLICGKRDFASFMAAGSNVTGTVRNVTDCKVERIGDIIEITVSADGFLYNMVRIICGTLLEVAQGRVSPEQVTQILESKDRSQAGPTLPACGLYLKEVTY